MVAEYRARGGRIQQREASDPFGTLSPSAAAAAAGSQSRALDAALRPPLKSDSEEEKSSRQADINWASKVNAAEAVMIKSLLFLESHVSVAGCVFHI